MNDNNIRLLNLLYEIRVAAGDKDGILMQEDLVKHIEQIKIERDILKQKVNRISGFKSPSHRLKVLCEKHNLKLTLNLNDNSLWYYHVDDGSEDGWNGPESLSVISALSYVVANLEDKYNN